METQLQTPSARRHADNPDALWIPEPSAPPEFPGTEKRPARRETRDRKSAVLHLAEHSHRVPKGSLWTRGLLLAEADILGEEAGTLLAA